MSESTRSLCACSPTFLPLLTAFGGSLIALVSVWFQSRLTNVRESKARREQRYHEDIEQSAVGFVNEMLILMSRAYWNKADDKEPGIGSALEALREKDLSVQARLKAMHRPSVEKHFSALVETYKKFIKELPKAPGGQAYGLMKEASDHAGHFFEAIYGSAPKDR
jgi:hypothetical protein